jgi:predicted TIM-barrel fold metal-dependent hydrolase
VEIIDAHHHIWQMKNLPWLVGEPVPRIFGQYESIRRDYPIEEYLADIRDCGVRKTVYVQVNWIPHQEVDETRWVQSIADKFGCPNAIVGFADLARSNVEETLAAHLESPLFRGIRQQLHWHVNPQYRFAGRPDLMNDSQWRRGFALLEKFGLVFELQIFASQMADGAKLAADFPETIIVLEHAGMLEDRSENGWNQWRAGMRLLAENPNVYTKISGLGTFLHRFDRDAIRPVVLETIEIFGPNRCMFGSNFPIEKIWTDYRTLFNGTASILDELNATEKAAVLGDTAKRIYRPGLDTKYG